MSDSVADAFHRAYYDAPASWKGNTWFGFGIQQVPLDMMVYQQLFYQIRPAFVVQTGVFGGGSLLYFAHLLDAMKAPAEAVVVGVEIFLRDEPRRLDHPRIHLVEGSSTAPQTLAAVRSLLPAGKQGLVSLDSDHAEAHVLAEMKLYADLVAVGSYLVVEDTNVGGHPVFPHHGPGPFEAVQRFFAEGRTDFVADDLGARQLVSFHHAGWLRRVR